MSGYSYLLVALFLPLFPLSMIFNVVFTRLRHPLLRALLLLGWPQIGVLLAARMLQAIPDWVTGWALCTALLYALRALSLRELGLWSSFVATSAWALLWLLVQEGGDLLHVQIYALGFGVPLVLLILLGRGLEQRFGAAFTGLHGGLAQSMPRLAGVLVPVVLAIIATPVFPAFFAMLAALLNTAPHAPLLALGVAGVWLLWSWAGARLLQGLIVGPPLEEPVTDISVTATWTYVLVMGALVIAGLWIVAGGVL